MTPHFSHRATGREMADRRATGREMAGCQAKGRGPPDLGQVSRNLAKVGWAAACGLVPTPQAAAAEHAIGARHVDTLIMICNHIVCISLPQATICSPSTAIRMNSRV